MIRSVLIILVALALTVRAEPVPELAGFAQPAATPKKEKAPPLIAPASDEMGVPATEAAEVESDDTDVEPTFPEPPKKPVVPTREPQTGPPKKDVSLPVDPLAGPEVPLHPGDPNWKEPAPQEKDAPSLTPPVTPSQNVTLNLINRLVQKGVLSKEDAADLIAQAEADAKIAQEQAAATQQAIAQVATVAQTAAEQSAPASEPEEDDLRVTYVPEVVKEQIRADVRADVIDSLREGKWSMPKLVPEWVNRIKLFGDIRTRYEFDQFPGGNDASGAFPNFNAINTGAPFNTAGDQFSPQLNVDQDRQRMRLRARFGADIELGKGFSSGLRVATGESNSPTSPNQSLGLPYQGQGGNFSKYAIWLDRAFIKYQLGPSETKQLWVEVGRFDNPFFTVSEIMWDGDIGFDGVAAGGRFEIFRGFTPFVVGGAFPVYNTDFNFSSNQPTKFSSYDKWLYAVQGGFDWRIIKQVNVKAGIGYYYFNNIEGQLSSPYVPLSPNDAGDTDASRPAFAQKGNTYMALRNIIPTEANGFGTTNQWQYYGLATKFQNLAFSGRLDYTPWDPFTISLMGEWVQNLAFDSGAIGQKAVNNRGALDDDLSDSIGDFVGGDSAWIVQLQIGHAALEKSWDWNVGFGYRYVESDAVVDGFTDSDFGGGGTNLKGWTVGGNLAFTKNVWLGVRYLSARSIAGPTFKEDIIQLDLNAKF